MQYKRNHAFYIITAILFVAWILQGCNGCNNKTKGTSQREENPPVKPTTPAPTAQDTLKTWAEQRLIQWKGWIDSSTAGRFAGNNLERTMVDTIAPADSIHMEEERFEQFKPFFVYSPDSSQVLDMVSYGNFLHKTKSGKVVLEAGEPDIEVAIVNVQTKNRERILFAGPSTVVKQAVWIDDHTVLIAGGMYDDQNRLLPVIWKYNTVSKLLENWEADHP